VRHHEINRKDKRLRGGGMGRRERDTWSKEGSREPRVGGGQMSKGGRSCEGGGWAGGGSGGRDVGGRGEGEMRGRGEEGGRTVLEFERTRSSFMEGRQ
jgi:hypothetical protein